MTAEQLIEYLKDVPGDTPVKIYYDSNIRADINTVNIAQVLHDFSDEQWDSVVVLDTENMINDKQRGLNEHIRIKMSPKEEKTFNGILTLRDVPVSDVPGADYNDNVLFLHNESEPLANLVNEFAQGEPITMYYHITTKRTKKTERLLRDLSGEVDVRVESELAYPSDGHWIHHNRFKIGEHDLNYMFGHFLDKWIFVKLVKY